MILQININALKEFYMFHALLMLVLFYSVISSQVSHSLKAGGGLQRGDAKRIRFVFGYAPLIDSLALFGGLFLLENSIIVDELSLFTILCIVNAILYCALRWAKRTMADRNIAIAAKTILSLIAIPLAGAFITYNICLQTYAIGERKFLGPWPYYRDYMYFALALIILYAALMKKYSERPARSAAVFLLVLTIWAFFPIPYYLQSRAMTREQYNNVYKSLYEDDCLELTQTIDNMRVLGGDNRGISYIIVQTHGRDFHGHTYKSRIDMREFVPSNTNGSKCFEWVYFPEDGVFFSVKSVPWPPY